MSTLKDVANQLEAYKGGSGSGNFGHSGRPGKIGGSGGGGSGGGGVPAVSNAKSTADENFKKVQKLRNRYVTLRDRNGTVHEGSLFVNDREQNFRVIGHPVRYNKDRIKRVAGNAIYLT